MNNRSWTPEAHYSVSGRGRVRGQRVYATKTPDQVSWFRPHLETSLSFIGRAIRDHSARITDVGGGESTLADDFLVRGWCNLTVLALLHSLDVHRTSGRVGQKMEHSA